jgi:hypothetical protein
MGPTHDRGNVFSRMTLPVQQQEGQCHCSSRLSVEQSAWNGACTPKP